MGKACQGCGNGEDGMSVIGVGEIRFLVFVILGERHDTKRGIHVTQRCALIQRTGDKQRLIVGEHFQNFGVNISFADASAVFRIEGNIRCVVVSRNRIVICNIIYVRILFYYSLLLRPREHF